MSTVIDKIRNNGNYGRLRQTLVSHGGQYGEMVEMILSEDGLIKGLDHVCKRCKRTLSGKKTPSSSSSSSSSRMVEDVNDSDDDDDDGDEESSGFERTNNTSSTSYATNNPYAVVEGLFIGPIPEELSSLSATELSLVSLINPIGKVIIHTKFAHSKTKVFACLNDISEVAKSLPNMAALDTISYLKSSNTEVSKLYKYRPFFVKRAIVWLKRNNRIYKEKNTIFPNSWNTSDEREQIDPSLHNVEEDEELQEGMSNETDIGGNYNTDGEVQV